MSAQRSRVSLVATYGFDMFTMSALRDDQAAQLSEGAMHRLGESAEEVDNIVQDIPVPAYKTLGEVPLALTLLMHVVRSFRLQSQDGEGVSSQVTSCSLTKQERVLEKTDVHQRSLRLMLHESDAS